MSEQPMPPPVATPVTQVAHVQDLIKDIPPMDIAIAEFNSMPWNQAPFRDIPSVLIAHLNRPNTTLPEPDWKNILSYFLSKQANHGLANLQDTYIFLTRITLPNTLILHRKCLLSMYLTRRNLPTACRLRYDSIGTTPSPAIPPTCTPPTNSPRSIFRSQQTPNGTRFLQWLVTPPDTAPMPAPHQMAHRVSDIDTYLMDDEGRVRGMRGDELVERTARVLGVWWGITVNTVTLMEFEGREWVGVERVF